MATYEELMQSAEQIRTNELPESNTHELVGQHLKNQVEHFNKEGNGIKSLIEANKKEVDGKLSELENKIEQSGNTGYAECSDEASVAARTVELSDFTLNKKARITIKMTNKTTVNNVTLAISGTMALPLFYNGVRAGINNTWKDGAILDIIYNGASYLATDFSDKEYRAEIQQYALSMANNPYYYRYNAALQPGGTLQSNPKRILLPFKDIDKIKSVSVGSEYAIVSWATYKEDLSFIYYKVLSATSVDVNNIPEEQKTDAKYISFCIKKATEDDISVWDNIGLEIVEKLDEGIDWVKTSPYRLVEEKREAGYYLSNGSFVSSTARLSITYTVENGLSEVLVTLKSGGSSSNPQNIIFWDTDGAIIWSNPNVTGEEIVNRKVSVPQGAVRLTISGDISGGFPVHADALSFGTSSGASEQLIDDSIIGLERKIILSNKYGINYKKQELISASNGDVLKTGANNNIRSSFLRVPASMKLTTNITLQSGGIAFYSEQRLGSFVSGVKLAAQSEEEIDIPYGAEYFIVCSDTDKEISLECTYNGSLNRTYRKFNLITKLNKPYTWGSSCVWFGSSTTVGVTSPNLEKIEDCYAKIISDKLGFTSYTNKAVSGSKVCDTESPTSIYNVILNYSAPVDTIFINGGQNDYNSGSPLGTIDDTGTDTFCGCYNAIFEYIKSTFPDANVIVIQPQTAKSTSNKIIAPLDAYRELIGQMAVKHGFDTIAGDAVFLDTEDGLFKQLMQTDGTHPTALGHRYYGEGIASILL